MGQNVSELIALHEGLTRKLRDLISSGDESIEAAVRELDQQESELFVQILEANVRSESDLRSRIQFLKDRIVEFAEGDKSMIRHLELLCADFEKLLEIK